MSPIVVPNFRLKYIASTSVPSMTALPRTANPIPAPRKKPPKTATSKLSSVTFGKDTLAKTKERPLIAIAVFIANCLPRIL